MSNPRARRWVFTMNNPAVELDFLVDEPELEYAVYQMEVGAEGTPHYQGYLMFKRQVYRNWVSRLLIDGCHLEVARGSPAQARNYCTKEETRMPGTEFMEIGVFPELANQGKRKDLEMVYESLISGITLAEYSHEHFGAFAKYPRLYERFQEAQIEGRTGAELCECHLLVGKPGTGKSSYAHSESLRLGGYRKQSGKWWDGYRGERLVVLDDFRGSFCSITDFKHWVDRYPLRVEAKGTFVNLAATRFLITSNLGPLEWWKEEAVGAEKEAITRRITKIWYFFDLGKYWEFDTFAQYDYWTGHGEIAPQIPRPETKTLPLP